MLQKRITIKEGQAEFLSRHRDFGFKNQSSLVRTAIDYIRKSLEHDKLIESAVLYSELYEEDSDLRELTESAMHGWPGD